MKPTSPRPLLLVPLAVLLAATQAAATAAPRAAASQAAAPAAQAAPELPAARGIIERYGALTGLAADKTTSRRVKGRVQILGMELKGTFEMVQSRPDHMQVQTELAGVGTMKQGFDGKVSWMDQAMVGPMLLDGGAHEQMKLQARYDYDAHDPTLYESVETVARTKFDGRDCYKLRLVQKPWPNGDPETTLNLRETFEYYEVESGLKAGSESVQDSPMGATPSTSTVSNYVKFGAIQYPTRSVLKGGGLELEMTVESITFDDVAAAELALPPEIAALVPKDG